MDNKSVFFDVVGFHYFLLVYKPPPSESESADPPRHHIVGFFSKEKISWDSNNLACILIFPPWQRKGLGVLLMGISYEISRREKVIGGPEKPISDLGKKGYKRFWAAEVARWLLSRDADEVVDVAECSAATWIAPEDCLLVLREMGVAEDAGTGPPKAREGFSDADAPSPAEDGEPQELVPRVRVSKAAVRAWVVANKLSLDRPCDPDGFVEGYAIKEDSEDDEEKDDTT